MELKFTEQLTYHFLRLVSIVIGFIPRRVSLVLGQTIGILVWLFLPLRKKICLENLTIAFPANSKSANRRILKHCYMHFGMVLMDFLRIPHLTKEKLSKYLEFEPESMELLDRCQKGLIVAAHVGNWEMFLPAMGLNGFNFTGVALIQKNRGASDFFKWVRESTGSHIVFKKKDSTKKMLQVLKNGFLGLASDQYAGRNGVMIDFFGRETSTPAGAAVFYIKSKVPFIVGDCILTSKHKYKINLTEVDFSNLPDNRDDAVRKINQTYNNILKKMILEHPDQYFWFHRKWRN